MPTLKFSDISPARQKLLRLCQDVNFGTIRDLAVQTGDPAFVPPPVVLRDIRLDIDEGSRPEIELADFCLRHDVRRLLRCLDDLQTGMIEQIEIRSGIPRRVLIRTRAPEVS
jgi:hypothetical protein